MSVEKKRRPNLPPSSRLQQADGGSLGGQAIPFSEEAMRRMRVVERGVVQDRGTFRTESTPLNVPNDRAVIARVPQPILEPQDWFWVLMFFLVGIPFLVLCYVFGDDWTRNSIERQIGGAFASLVWAVLFILACWLFTTLKDWLKR